MSKMIQIRNVPDEVHQALKIRAAKEGMSLSDFLRREVTRVADRPSLDEGHRAHPAAGTDRRAFRRGRGGYDRSFAGADPCWWSMLR